MLAIPPFFKTIKFQLSAMLLASFYIMLLFTWQYKQTIITEDMPIFLQVDEKTKQLANPITVGIHINSFPEFSFYQNNFTIDAIVWFRFAKASESLDTLNMFTFENSKMLENGELIYKSKPMIKILDKDVVVSYHVQANFMSDLKFKKFPISDHRLNIILQNRSATAEEIVFVTDPKNLTLSGNIMVKNWVPKKMAASAGYVKSVINQDQKDMHITYPAAAFSIDFEGQGAQLPISLYFPLFLLFFIILISLMLSLSDSNRLSLASAGVPALVLFRLVIDAVSPSTGYPTHIDQVYYMISFLSLIILFFQTYIVLIAQKDKDTLSHEKVLLHSNKLENVNALMFVGVLVLLIVFLTISFVW